MRVLIYICVVLGLASSVYAATTWQFSTKISTGSGSVQVRNKTPQTLIGSLVYHNYTTSADVAVRVRSSNGWLVSSVSRNGVVSNLQKTTALDATFNKSGGLTGQSLLVTFAAAPAATVSVLADPAGVTVSPSTTVSTFQAHSVQFHLYPVDGWSVTGASVSSGGYISLQDAQTLQNMPLSGTYTQPLLINIIAESGVNNISVTTSKVVTPISEDEDVTDPQMTAFFTNMSTQAAKVTASNADLAQVLRWGCSALFGGLMAVLFGSSWKG